MRFVQMWAPDAATPEWGWAADGLVWSGPQVCRWLTAIGYPAPALADLAAPGRTLTDLLQADALAAATAMARAAFARLGWDAHEGRPPASGEAPSLPTPAGRPLAWPEAEARLLAPVAPTSLRDFYAFEAHVRTARAQRGLPMIQEWYEMPVFYFSNHSAIFGPEDVVPAPAGAAELDYELEVACVIGRSGRDIPAAAAAQHIAGFVIMNDWSARDVQRREMRVGLGPAKGKDFATSLGPYLVTPDELAATCLPSPAGDRHRLAMVARVNGIEYSRGNLADLFWTFAQMIERAAANVTLRPGDVLGSGTVGTGCILELGGARPWLASGDVVELAVDGLGVLRNTVGPPVRL